MLRKVISLFLVLLLSCTLFAQGDTAVLYGTGSVYLNGAQISNSAAVTNGDVIQTKDTGAANLNAAGSTIVIQSNSIVRFQNGGLSLDRGSVSIASGKGMSVSARDFKIVPAGDGWTEYYVSRSSGLIEIVARKSSISISCGSSTSTLKEGQQVSRDDAPDCGIAGIRHVQITRVVHSDAIRMGEARSAAASIRAAEYSCAACQGRHKSAAGNFSER